MTRAEEVRKGLEYLHQSCMVTTDAITAQALGEIAITLAMMYDLMRNEKEHKAQHDDDLK